jgi:hypothetical protein
LITSVLINDTDVNSGVVVVDNLEVEAVPEPPALPLFATGLGMIGLLAWRKKRWRRKPWPRPDASAKSGVAKAPTEADALDL